MDLFEALGFLLSYCTLKVPLRGLDVNLLNCSIPRIRILKDVQVLVIDNDRDALYLYTVLLEECGANVIVAASIEEALEVFGWLLPDILICEMQFYGERIDTLTTKLSEMKKSAGNYIPAIAITTWMTDNLAQILDASFEGYLLKPVDPDILVSLIRNLSLCSKSIVLERSVGLLNQKL